MNMKRSTKEEDSIRVMLGKLRARRAAAEMSASPFREFAKAVSVLRAAGEKVIKDRKAQADFSIGEVSKTEMNVKHNERRRRK